MKLLVVAAHPDDEVLGCGGTIARAVALGVDVSVLILGEGISARFPVGNYDSSQYRMQHEARTQSARSSMQILGIEDYELGELLCGQFDTYPLISIVKRIENKLSTFNPDILLTHSFEEVNIDHRITYQAVEVACRPTRDHVPLDIYSFEIICSGSWTFSKSFQPNTFVDITESWPTKLRAWASYTGEQRPFPFPRSTEGLKALAQYRGMMAGLPLAEAFSLLRSVKK